MADARFQSRVLEKVILNYCNDHIIKQYKQESENIQEIMLGGLKTVFDNTLYNELQQINNINLTRLELNDTNFKNSSDPLLHMVFKSMGVAFFVRDTKSLKECLHNWGLKQPKMWMMARHNQAYQQQLRMIHQNMFEMSATNSTYTSMGNICTDFSNLQKIYIKDLKLFQPAKGKYLEGKIITPPVVQVGTITCLEDEKGDYVLLGIYNVIPLCKEKYRIAELKFPVGTIIKISQPFYKIFADGNPGVRIDSPEEVLFCSDENVQTFENIIMQGKTLTEAGDNIGAFELYLNASSKYKEIIPLLNNRSQSQLKLGEFEESLLDASAVLFLDHKNVKARERYRKSLEGLGYDELNSLPTWKKVLSLKCKSTERLQHGSREKGNNAFKEGKFLEAIKQYTAAMDDLEICVILNNLAAVSTKCNMYHTTIAAASACLRIASNEEYQGIAGYLMTEAFFMAGEKELAKTSAKEIPSLKHFTEKPNLNKATSFARKMLFSPSNSSNDSVQIHEQLKSVEVSEEFTHSAVEHCYISKTVRGLKTKRHVNKSELVFIDYFISYTGKIEETHQFSYSINSNTRVVDKDACLNLKRMVLGLVKYDGLLGQKVLLLNAQCGKLKKNEVLPLVKDLEWMAYKKFSYEIKPFLSQSPIELGVNQKMLSSAFIDVILNTNVFQLGFDKNKLSNGSALCLRTGLFNHNSDPNCTYVAVGNSMMVFAWKDIKVGEQLTIAFHADPKALKKWEM